MSSLFHEKLSYQFFQETPFECVFTRCFDVVIFGAGYAGFAAALEARAQGHEVLLVDAGGDLTWETGRAFAWDAGSSEDMRWQDWLAHLREHGAISENVMVGGMAEVLATRRLLESGAKALYYASPVALEWSGDRIESVLLATQAGLRRVWGAQWIDATETGLLHRLAGVQDLREPAALQITLALHRTQWAGFEAPQAPRGTASYELREGAYPHERLLVVQSPDYEIARTEDLLANALESLHETWGTEIRKTHMSRASFLPYPLYGKASTRQDRAIPGLIAASPAVKESPVDTPAQRFALGLGAAESLVPAGELRKPSPDLEKPLSPPRAVRREQADVAVAGLGTGGALAAIAAGRLAQRVVAVEPLSLPGGIGTAGGIHMYHMGYMGGLQDEIDREVLALNARFGKIFQTGAFSPWAKRMVLRRKLEEAGVETFHGARLFHATCEGGSVHSALAATPKGVVQIDAAGWVDGTADAVLVSLADGETWFGREGDRQTQCFSQSAGILHQSGEQLPRTNTTNIDSGWCDATDPEDLTRARLEGIDQYLGAIKEGERVVYITPAIGLRQGPMVVTDHIVTMDDVVFPRHFEDCIGYFCCKQDTHNSDAYFEDDDTFFWVWVMGQRTGGHLAGEIPYRSLLPLALDNVWVGSRAFGVAQGVQYAARQQRDLQRVGEVAGIAAALAARDKHSSRNVPIEELRKHLRASGADELGDDPDLRKFGNRPDLELLKNRPRPDLTEALRCLEEGKQARPLWIFRQLDEEKRTALLERLQSAPEGSESRWVCAAVAGFHGLPEAEEPLLAMVRQPTEHLWNLPRALGILRNCATFRALNDLETFTVDPEKLTLDLRILVTRIIESLAVRHDPLPADERDRMMVILQRLRQKPIPGSLHANKYSLSESAHAVLLEGAEGFTTKATGNRALSTAVDDNSWKLDFALTQALRILDRELAREVADTWGNDARVIVRRAFTTL